MNICRNGVAAALAICLCAGIPAAEEFDPAYYTTEARERYGDKVVDGFLEEPAVADMLNAASQEKRDNAFLHYALAGQLQMSLAQHEAYMRIPTEGFDPDNPEHHGLIADLQPALHEIRRGLNTEVWIPPVLLETNGLVGYFLPPNYLTTWLNARALVVEGCYYESRGQNMSAHESYMNAYRLSLQYLPHEYGLFERLMNVAVGTFAAEGLQRHARRNNLPNSVIMKALVELSHYEHRQLPFEEMMAREWDQYTSNFMSFYITDATITRDQWKEYIHDIAEREFLERPEWRSSSPMRDYVRELYMENPESFVPEPSELAAQKDQVQEAKERAVEAIRVIVESNGEEGTDEYRDALKMLPPLLLLRSSFVGNWESAITRQNVLYFHLRLAQVLFALKAYHNDHDTYPESLDALTPRYLYHMPLDPFTDAPFQYTRLRGGEDYLLYGVGPDKEDGNARVPYDPSNGTLSEGDLWHE